MEDFINRIQSLMNEVYNEWQKEENNGKSKWDILNNFSEAHQMAVVFGNFNQQVENGGIHQWIYNGYFHDDSEKLTAYLESGAGLDERCQKILDTIYKLDQCAQDTDCGRDGHYTEPDDEDSEWQFIGDMIDCNGFDTWYYAQCDGDDWWKTVCGVIENVTGHNFSPVQQAGQSESVPPAPAPSADKPSVYEEISNNAKVINGELCKGDVVVSYNANEYELASDDPETSPTTISTQEKSRSVAGAVSNAGEKPSLIDEMRQSQRDARENPPAPRDKSIDRAARKNSEPDL